MKYILYPRSVVQLSEEIKLVCDDYWGKKIDVSGIKEILTFWASNSELFYDNEISKENINRSIAKIIGKKRVNLIFSLLEIQ